MAEKTHQSQTTHQTTQTETAVEVELAKKLLTGEALREEEASLLMDEKVAREVSRLLWHLSFWGW
jgi:hypothetical protein